MLDESGLGKAPDLAKIFDLYNSQTTTVNTLWNIYIVLALGILGFIYKDAEMRANWRIKIGFTVGFLVFAQANRTAILRSQNILFAIKTFLHGSAVEEASPFRQVLLAHEAQNPKRIGLGHLIFTALVLLAMWLPELF